MTYAYVHPAHSGLLRGVSGCTTLEIMTSPATTLQQPWLVRHSPVYYGWLIWIVSSIAIMASTPGQSFSISLFIDHYIVEFGMDRTTISGLYGLGTFLGSLSLTWLGRQIDVRGNRLIMLIVTALFALSLMACSLISGPIPVFLSFLALRGLGQGSLGLTSTSAVAIWFERRRGWAIGLMMVGFSLMQGIYLPWLHSYIETYGWRQTWVVLGLAVGAIMLPLIWWIIRDKPEDLGLLPDGKPAPTPDELLRMPGGQSLTLRQAQRTAIFWVFVFGRVVCAAFPTGLIFHQVSIFSQVGHNAQVAAETFALAMVLTAVATVFGGWFLDRIPPGIALALQMFSLGALCVSAMLMTELWLLVIYALSVALVFGFGNVFDGAVWISVFGRQHQGAIRGFTTTLLIAGTSLGPILLGFSYDYFGSYQPMLWLGAGLSLIALVMSLIVRRPRLVSSPQPVSDLL